MEPERPPVSSPISRRTALGVLAGTGVAAALSGCGGSDSRTYDVSGSLILRRVSDVPVLTRN